MSRTNQNPKQKWRRFAPSLLFRVLLPSQWRIIRCGAKCRNANFWFSMYISLVGREYVLSKLFIAISKMKS